MAKSGIDIARVKVLWGLHPNGQRLLVGYTTKQTPKLVRWALAVKLYGDHFGTDLRVYSYWIEACKDLRTIQHARRFF